MLQSIILHQSKLVHCVPHLWRLIVLPRLKITTVTCSQSNLKCTSIRLNIHHNTTLLASFSEICFLSLHSYSKFFALIRDTMSADQCPHYALFFGFSGVAAAVCVLWVLSNVGRVANRKSQTNLNNYLAYVRLKDGFQL